jgi:hypothetical protein
MVVVESTKEGMSYVGDGFQQLNWHAGEPS